MDAPGQVCSCPPHVRTCCKPNVHAGSNGDRTRPPRFCGLCGDSLLSEVQKTTVLDAPQAANG